jgi:hypothetical protein
MGLENTTHEKQEGSANISRQIFHIDIVTSRELQK